MSFFLVGVAVAAELLNRVEKVYYIRGQGKAVGWPDLAWPGLAWPGHIRYFGQGCQLAPHGAKNLDFGHFERAWPQEKSHWPCWPKLGHFEFGLAPEKNCWPQGKKLSQIWPFSALAGIFS